MTRDPARSPRLWAPVHRAFSIVVLLVVLLAVAVSVGALDLSSRTTDLCSLETHALDVFGDEESFGPGPKALVQPAVPLRGDGTLLAPDLGVRPSGTAFAASCLSRSPPLA
jgi:hypothetical protein